MDERYLQHRLKSTSLAAVTGGVCTGGWFLIQYFSQNIIRWDLFIIMGIMAITKLLSLFILKKIN